jgi:two-component system, NtrC family, sensor histidine kinase HydH
MRLGVRAGAESSLAIRLAWLTALRLLVLTVFLVVTGAVYLGGFAPGGFSNRVALITVAAAYFAAGVYAGLLRVGRALSRVAYAQLITDQITWTAIVYISGGAASGATSLYGLTCLSGAILLGLPGALTAAISGAVAFVGLCAALVSHVLPPPFDQQHGVYPSQWSDAGYPVFVTLLALAVVTTLASYLAERLRATGGRLVAATARAEEVEDLAALGRLAAGLAHEIRNPLGAIAGSIELLRSGGALAPEDQRLCEIIERETSRLNDLVGDMLELSRRRAPAKARLDLAGLARDVVLLSEKSGRGADVHVRYEGPGEAMVVGDAAQLRQVVWNLLRNAVQVSSAGAEVVLRVTAEADGGTRLEVADSGPGIPPEAHAQLFDAFFTTRSHGMGIGLAVVKRIVDDHGFTIEVQSAPGHGATFVVSMPPIEETALAEADATALAEAPPPRSSAAPPALAHTDRSAARG